MIPSSKPDTIIHYDSPVYSGQFSDDGNFFFACVKDFKVRMYDTSNPVCTTAAALLRIETHIYFSINGDITKRSITPLGIGLLRMPL
jgi:WD40 repeat protein